MAAARLSVGLMLLAMMATLGQTKPCISIADKVLRGGNIYTLDEAGTTASALAIKDGIIFHVGSDEDIAKRIGVNTTVVELGGLTVIPGFVDAHMHVLTGAELLLKCNLNYQPLDMAGVLAHVQGCLDDEGADRDDENDWLEVVNMDTSSALTNGVVPKRDLDGLNTVRPIMIRGADFHVVFANSRALQASDIDESTPDPPGGKFERIPGTNELSGVLLDNAWHQLAGRAPLSDDERAMAVRAAFKLLRENGITTFQEASARESMAPMYAALKAEGGLTARAWFDYRINPPATPEEAPALVAQVKAALAKLHDPAPLSPAPTTKWNAVKMFLDGVHTYPANTAAMIEPYRVPPANDSSAEVWIPDPASHIDPYWIPAVLHPTVEALVASGIDAQMHADGDMAVRVALDAVEKARAGNPDADYRIGVAHAEIVNPLEWPRFAQLGVDAIMSFQWAQPGPNYIPSTMRSMGPERYGGHMQPFQEVTERGRLVTFGSDWPIDPMDHFLALKVAITRSGDPENPNSPASRGDEFNGTLPGRALSRSDAMRSITNAGARFLRAEAHIGSLEKGKLADLAVLEHDYFSVPEEEAGRNRVLLTMVGGEVLYVAEGKTFGEGVVAKFPNDDAESARLERRTVGGFGGKSLGEEGRANVARMWRRGGCDHGGHYH